MTPPEGGYHREANRLKIDKISVSPTRDARRVQRIIYPLYNGKIMNKVVNSGKLW